MKPITPVSEACPAKLERRESEDWTRGCLAEAKSADLDAINKSFICTSSMIRSFADAETARLFETGKSRRLPPDIRKRATMRLGQLHAATRLEDLRLPPSNRLEALKNDRAGQHSIRISDQWRVGFRFLDGDAFDVEITDYH